MFSKEKINMYLGAIGLIIKTEYLIIIVTLKKPL